MKRLMVGSIVICALLARHRVVHADPAADAKRLFDEGTTAYSLGEFAEAITKYKAAFKLKPEPVFLYNIAQAYRLSNDFEQALFFYKSYLRNSPEAANREEVEGRIGEMDEQLSKQHKTATAPPNGPISPDHHADDSHGVEPAHPQPVKIPDPGAVGDDTSAATPAPAPLPANDTAPGRPIYKKWWFWAGIGAVAVGTVAVVAVASGGNRPGPGSHFGTVDLFQ